MINPRPVFNKINHMGRINMNTIKTAMNKIKTIPAKPETPYPQVISWFFSLCVMLMFIYVCEMTGM